MPWGWPGPAGDGRELRVLSRANCCGDPAQHRVEEGGFITRLLREWFIQRARSDTKTQVKVPVKIPVQFKSCCSQR